tara:strand:- start:425 stop:721 length:297 start_codon:yes stop_codon:yes gene_type:complete
MSGNEKHITNKRAPKLNEGIKILTLTTSKSLEGGLVSEAVLATLHDEGETRVDALLSLFLLRGDYVNLNSRNPKAPNILESSFPDAKLSNLLLGHHFA